MPSLASLPGYDDQTRMADALAALAEREGRPARGMLPPPEANIAGDTGAMLARALFPYIAGKAVAAAPPVSMAPSAAPPVSMAPAGTIDTQRVLPPMQGEGLPPEGATGEKLIPPNQNPGALGLAGDLANLAGLFVGGPEPAIAKGVAAMLGPAARRGVQFWADAGPRGPLLIAPGETRVSTRFPTGVTTPRDPLREHLNIGLPEMMADPNFAHNMQFIPDYPGFEHLRGRSPEEIARGYIERAADNMRYILERSPAEMRLRSPRWYEGANVIADANARKWGIPRPASSAAEAVLSPQRDWFVNATLQERVGDILHGASGGRILTPDMEAFGRTLEMLGGGKMSEIAGMPDADILRRELMKPQSLVNLRENQERFSRIIGKRLDQLDDPKDQALWIRLFDQAHQTPYYRSITPEGDYGPWITKDSDPSQRERVKWAPNDEVAKAIQAMRSGGNMDVISPLLGGKHKVRSFYNDIELPDDRRFRNVTGDTHQVAAGQMRPLSGASPAVGHHLGLGAGEKSSSVTGVQGTYGLIADATRSMADELGMIARSAQSSSWEPVRELFTDVFKRSPRAKEVDNVWRAYDRGEIALDDARRRIFDIAGGIKEPSYGQPNFVQSSPTKGGSTYR